MRKRGTINTYNLFMNIYFFLVFFYVYNISIINQLSNSSIISILIIFFSLFNLLLAHFKYLKINRKMLFIFLMLFSFIVTFRNGDLTHGSYVSYFYIIFILASIYLLSLSNKWHKIAIKIFNLFIFEHIIASIFCYMFPDFYYSNILPIFKQSSKVLIYQFNHSQIAGFTQHYSTNALYLVSGLLVNTALLFNKKDKRKKNYIFLIINMVALLLTGKRSQVITYILSVIFIFLIKYKNNLIKLFKKFIKLTILFTVLISLLSNFIPNITNSFTRAYESMTDKSAMNSRNILYDLAISEFNQHKLFGIGWNNYKYVYNLKINDSLKEMDYMSVHNIYLQTLCEVGLIGSLLIYYVFIYLLVISIKDFFKENNEYQKDRISIFIIFHVFFLLEGILGNSLYDLQTFSPYAIFLSMYMYYHYELKTQKYKIKE